MKTVGRPRKAKGEQEYTFIDERVSVLLPIFEKLSHFKPTKRKTGVKTPSEVIPGYEELAVREAAILQAKYQDDNGRPVATTIVKRAVPALKKALKDATKTHLKDANQIYPVQTVINQFGDTLSLILRPMLVEVNEEVKAKVEQRTASINRVEIDLTPYLELANKVLNRVSNGLSIDWKDVSCSLALVTGRRMAEIHLSAEFDTVDTYTVLFKGQLKGKGRMVDGVKLRHAEFEIPTLVKSELVVAGLKYLTDNGYRLPKSEKTQRVNDRYSKVLSGKVKDNWMIFQSDDKEYTMTYHKFRACYFLASFENVQTNESIEAVDYDVYAQQILGDDASTVASYKKFRIKPGTVTRI